MGDKLPKLTAKEAEALLLQNGFVVDRQRGSHRIYKKDSKRMVLPLDIIELTLLIIGLGIAYSEHFNKLKD